MKRLLTILLLIVSANVFGQIQPQPSGVLTPLTTNQAYFRASDSTYYFYNGTNYLWNYFLNKQQADKLYTPINSPAITPFSLSTGYGLVGSSFNGSVARTWTADTTSVDGLVSKSRLSTNLGGYVPKSRTITINGATRDLSANRTWNVGTVTSVGTGYGLSGGTITSSGTLSVDTSAIATKSYTNKYVPYDGATKNVNLGEFGIRGGYALLDTTPTNTPTTRGTIYWDDSRSTAALIMNGTTQEIGQDSYFYVKNSSGSPIAKGKAVRFAGTDGGSGHILIAPFLADGTYPSSYFMGVTAEAIGNGEFGQVMQFGELKGVNTNAYVDGALLYASTTSAGGFQTTAPVAPNNIVLIAAVINAANNGSIIVRPTYGSNINDDEGVKITNPIAKDLLQYKASGLWENVRYDSVGFVPYTGAITDVNLGTNNGIILEDNGTNTSISITSSSTGNGAIKIDKNTNGEGLRINNNGIGNAIYSNNASTGTGVLIGNASTGKGLVLANSGAATGDPFTYTLGGAAFMKAKIDYLGNITGNSFIKSGGTSSQFLKADGSIDSNSYALSSALGNYLLLTGGTLTGALNGTSASFSAGITSEGAFIGTRSKSQSFFAGVGAGNASISGGSNTFVGDLAGTLVTSGSSNTMLGRAAGTAQTTASGNTLIGQSAGVSLTTGGNNTFVGNDAGSGITTGTGNTILGKPGVIGTSSLTNNIILASGAGIKAQHDGTNWTFTGGASFSSDITANTVKVGLGAGNISTNTVLGQGALPVNTTGYGLVAIGNRALEDNTTGTDNIAIGNTALVNNTTGYENIAIGTGSLITNTIGNRNISIGFLALSDNTDGEINVGVGNYALEQNTTGYANTSIGHLASQLNTTGYRNTALGQQSLYYNTTGSENIGIGALAGASTTAGNPNQTSTNSVYIGYDTRSSASGNTNEIVIGYSGRGLGSNTTSIGNSSTTFGRFWGNLLVGNSSNSGEALQITGTSKFNGSATVNSSATKLFEIGSTTGTGGYTRFTYNTTISIGYIGNSTQLSGNGIVGDLELRADNDLFLTTTSGSIKLASTGAATFSGALSGTSATFSDLVQTNKAGGLVYRAYYGSGNNRPLDINIDGGNGDAQLTWNTTYNGGWKYYLSNYAAKIASGNGLIFSVAASGTAGNTISWVDALTINSSGNVGIGNTNPGSYNSAANDLVIGTNSGNHGITIAAGTTGFSGIYLADGTTGNEAYRGYIEYGHTSDYLAFGTSASERMRIFSGGNVFIGSSPSDAGYKLDVNGTGRFSQTNALTADILTVQGGGASGAYGFAVKAANGDNIFSTNNLTYNSTFGGSVTTGSGSGNTLASGSIDIGKDIGLVATQGIVVNNARVLAFASTGAATFSSSVTTVGDLLVGTTTSNGRISLDYSDANNNGIYINETTGAANTYLMLFRSNTVAKGSIQINSGNTGVNFNTTSDYRLKEDLQDYSGLEIVNRIKTYDFQWKNTNFRSYGVLAHELQEVMPDIVGGLKDAIDENGEPIIQGVDYGKLTPILIKAIQELNQKITQLESK